MSLVWTLIASFLYAEIIIVLLMVLPVASPKRWQRFFRSRFLSLIGRQAQVYFYLLLAILVLFLLEAIREMRKYSNTDPLHDHDLKLGLQHSMRLFRAQRNFYISGFAIFLVLVIRRLVLLISAQATLLAQSEASMRQAESATVAARTLMSQQKKTEDSGDNTDVKEATEQQTAATTELLGQLKEKIRSLDVELQREKKDKEALKSQAESLNREYDRLTDEYAKLQNKVTISSKNE